jgi:hypothetical protein
MIEVEKWETPESNHSDFQNLAATKYGRHDRFEEEERCTVKL